MLNNFFLEYKNIFLSIHVLSVILGMGGALISDILFTFFIKNKNIEKKEEDVLNYMSKLVWISLLFIVITGLFVYLSDPLKYKTSSDFISKMFIIIVLCVNGIFFKFITHDNIKKIDFKSNDFSKKEVRQRRFSVVFGSVSIVSWLASFILGYFNFSKYNFLQIILAYLIFVFLGIIFSLFYDKKLVKN